MRRLIPLLLFLAALGPVLFGRVSPAEAHPMGNFSINHYTQLQVSSNGVRVLYLIDMAEIPTFQDLNSLHVGQVAGLTATQRRAYIRHKASDLLANLSLRLNGRILPLRLAASDLIFPPGAGGLPTERIYLVLDSPVTRMGGTLTYQDNNFPGRAGWKELVVARGSGIETGAARVSSTDALTHYPGGVTVSPPQDLQATMRITAPLTALDLTPYSAGAVIHSVESPLLNPQGGWSALARGLTRVGSGAGAGSTVSSWSPGRTDALTNLIGRDNLPLGVLLLSLVVAFWFGAGHALSPGHGKTIVAAYLVGSRGTPAHAALLGLTVTATHTAGVFALGLVTIYLSRYIVPDQLYPWIGAASGALVALMGCTLFARRLRRLRRTGTSLPSLATGGHEDHVHTHDGVTWHRHDEHGHTHHVDAAHLPPIVHAYSERTGEHQHRHVAVLVAERPALHHAVDGHHHSHDGDHGHDHTHAGVQNHAHAAGVPHRHGLFGKAHTHAPSGIAEGERISLRNLIGLGISGGLLPCPSALVVLLAAIAFHRVAFGMLLIVAFSLGLASVLTGIGLLVLYGRRFLARLQQRRARTALAVGRAIRVLPVFSALVVTMLGTAICFGSLHGGTIAGMPLNF